MDRAWRGRNGAWRSRDARPAARGPIRYDPGMPESPYVVVSGLPRSGTSLLMQMLAAGGLPPLCDGLRTPDAENPRGYLEWEPIKRIAERPELLDAARGRAVKVISALLRSLPADRRYRVVFALRSIAEVQASQRAMLRARGREPADDVSELDLAAHLDDVRAWLGRQRHIETCYVDYRRLVDEPHASARRIRAFLGRQLDVEAMVAAVDSTLYRHRSPEA